MMWYKSKSQFKIQGFNITIQGPYTSDAQIWTNPTNQ